MMKQLSPRDGHSAIVTLQTTSPDAVRLSLWTRNLRHNVIDIRAVCLVRFDEKLGGGIPQLHELVSAACEAVLPVDCGAGVSKADMLANLALGQARKLCPKGATVHHRIRCESGGPPGLRKPLHSKSSNSLHPPHSHPIAAAAHR